MSDKWQVRVSIPVRVPAEQRDRLFTAIADAVTAWEPADRDGWDALVEAGPVGLTQVGAYAVACPECIAQAGEACFDLRTNRPVTSMTIHQTRVWAAREAAS